MAFIKENNYIVVDYLSINTQSNLARIYVDIYEENRDGKRVRKMLETNVDNIVWYIPANNKGGMKVATYMFIGDNLAVIGMEWAVSDDDKVNETIEIEKKVAMFRSLDANVDEYQKVFISKK